jgi:hypothetical protein
MYNYEKIIKNLTNLNNKLDFSFINKDTIEKINNNNDIYTYDNIKTNIEILSKIHEIKKRYNTKLKISNNLHEQIIFIVDGYARGVSKYVNKFKPQKYKLSNAYVKLWEMYSTFDWLINTSSINCFHIVALCLQKHWRRYAVQNHTHIQNTHVNACTHTRSGILSIIHTHN